MSESLYDVLGVKTTATTDEITTAYKQLCRKWHPDRNKDPEAKGMFQKISSAKEILVDKKKRTLYDKFGDAGLQGGPPLDTEDILKHAFGNFNFSPQQWNKPVSEITVPLPLSTYFTEKTYELTYPRQTRCDHCEGSGSVDKIIHKCRSCDGSGFIMAAQRQGPVIRQFKQQCVKCSGSGNDPSYLCCSHCQGKGTIQQSETITVPLPQPFSSRVFHTVVDGAGSWYQGGNIDLLVSFELILPEGYTLTADDRLLLTLNISLSETLCGFSRFLPFPDGTKILLTSSQGNIINSDNIFVLRNFGLTTQLERDDVLLKFNISEYPRRITLDSTKQLTFSNLAKALGSKSPEYCGVYDVKIEVEDLVTLNDKRRSDDSAINCTPQ
jgi:DnaJ-class molecular chaperone